jgi:DNA-binding transcriptional LysR family regulator
MELYQLRTFVTVARQGNLTGAAELLHVSQPAASAQIKALEAELGVALFERRPTGLSVTKVGEALVPYAERVISAAAELKTRAKVMRGEVAGKLCVGAVIDPGYLRIGELVSRLLALHPLLDIGIHHRVSAKIADSVRSGEIDAGFFLGSTAGIGLSAFTLSRPIYRVVGPAAWAERLQVATWSDLAELPWVSAPKQGFHYQMLAEIFGKHDLRPTKMTEADQESIIFSLVCSGAGLSLMREDLAFAAQVSGEIVIWGEATAKTCLSMLFRQDRLAAPEIQAMLAVLRSIWELDPSQPDGHSSAAKQSTPKVSLLFRDS